MRPSVPLVLGSALWKLDDMMRAENDPVKSFDLSRLRLILSVVERDWEGSAADRVADIDALLTLLRRGAELSPRSLGGMLQDTVGGACWHVDLRISALEAMRDDLLSALIELHAWLEVASAGTAKALLRDVWSYLECRARRDAVMESTW